MRGKVLAWFAGSVAVFTLFYMSKGYEPVAAVFEALFVSAFWFAIIGAIVIHYRNKRNKRMETETSHGA